MALSQRDLEWLTYGVPRREIPGILKDLDRWNWLRVEWRGKKAPLVEVLHAPKYKQQGWGRDNTKNLSWPERPPRSKSEAPKIDPMTGEVLPREPKRQCRGKTVTGSRCQKFTLQGDYCNKHANQWRSDAPPLASPEARPTEQLVPAEARGSIGMKDDVVTYRAEVPELALA